MRAATAAYCESTGGQIVKLPVSTSTGRLSSSGTSIQPIRQPVMEKYLEKDPKTTADREVSQAELVVGASLGYSMPW